MDGNTDSNNDWNIIRINEFMKASLRIGNLLSDLSGGTVTVRGITKDGVWIEGAAGPAPSTAFNPIPLTEEWLKKFGFTLVEESPFEEVKMKYWVRNRVCLFFNESEPFNTYLLGFADQRFGKYSVVTGNWIEYVHTIQNAFHSLTGEELTVKE